MRYMEGEYIKIYAGRIYKDIWRENMRYMVGEYEIYRGRIY